MSDITMCTDKGCKLNCYRRLAYPNIYQSYSNFKSKGGKCKYFLNGLVPITMREYQQKMDKVIKNGREVSEILINMLEEASKYEIKKDGVKRLDKRKKS